MQRTHSRGHLGTARRRFGNALALLWLVAAAAPAGATTLVLEGTANLLERSDTIVRGRVLSSEARMHPEHQFIYTYVTLQVDEVLKGSAAVGQKIVLEELGGQVGRWIHQVDAVPAYESGEEVLSFLEDRDGGLYRTYGFVQGKFRFETDTRTGQPILTRPATWTETVLAADGAASDLTAMRADGTYLAEPLLTAIREWVALH